jgi:hypothetical protein
MKIKTIYSLKKTALFAFGMITLLSCEKYLDKAPEANITENEVFNKFRSYQGYVENMYQSIIDLATRDADGLSCWNWGDDVIVSSSYRMDGNFVDNGDYMGVTYNTNISPFFGQRDTQNGTRRRKGYWDNGWLGIRNANLAIENIDKCSDCTIEQKNLLLGQAYFFRGYFHFEILRAWGGVPYIDKVFEPTQELKLPRLSYQETAAKITEDMKKAAELLPANWDQTETGKQFVGQNRLRITKGAAYGYMGKNLLYSASPLMNGVTTGNYVYDAALCKEAAKAFFEVIKLADADVYQLEAWNKYSDNFYKVDRTVPHGKEIIFTNPIYGNCRYEYACFFLNTHGGWGVYSSPTENYVENFGMANGLPLTESDAGFNPLKPWDNRDPRFYYNILKHNDPLVVNTSGVPAADVKAALQVGGRHRSSGNSISGYGMKKFHPVDWNKFDNVQRIGDAYFQVPKMRLADIYLMYAEAVNEGYGPSLVPADIAGGLTAVAATNIVRTRANVPNVDSRFLASKETFREILWKERAVELAFENHRWYDLRRWFVAHELKYREKYSLNFDANLTSFTKSLYVTKVFDMKHYWLPFQTTQATLYSDFKQNPGW